jgi:hypothetical protein
MVFGTSGPRENAPKFLFLKPNSFFKAMIAQVSLKKYLSSEFWACQFPGEERLSGLEALGPQASSALGGKRANLIEKHNFAIFI